MVVYYVFEKDKIFFRIESKNKPSVDIR